MKKDLALIGGLFLLIAVLLIFGGRFTSVGFLKPKSRETTSAASKVDQLKIRNATFKIRVVSSAKDKSVGLSNRESLPMGEGILFVFSESAEHQFWMKDMKFAIDIIWIDSNKKIVDIAENAAPEPQKSDKELTKYSPRSAAKYVLEINAGIVSLNDIHIGDAVKF